ncbi:hypothetical protein [Brucella intermedia]|jgi:hypothetical protein|uniref:hypothetical protein n=1 Tax=Brucella intermedia TaxID=94625 RepID=UPI000395EE7F|nr:hypothetical protein [Brucella intermedia]ERI12606.1 hypothetical protein O206_11510 [Ochrobactrum sp. EGD-AQ16]PJR90040.1 hypothetical protein CN881_12665 [Ochrobactrum sp. 721/2009]PJT16672.1 hypothetical protein CN880_10070 [Ochrobactrum sp. 720/2009]PJT26494.1 hypothetical protein CN879_06035 [Ochrobactrum sp. 715/2009]PJT26816.1 hypothetical protein CN878_20405 [Ochrobactrum sp. 695/2009]PJT36014.1 hypothetical protein CN877_08480 [Ochrobactrum sp. 689/2009]
MQVFVNIRPAARVLAAGTALSLVFGSAAMAADANAVAERIKALYAKQGGELSFANVQASGSDIVLQGTKIKLPTIGEKETAIGDVTLQNVQDAPDGGYSIEQVTVPDLALAGETDKNDKAEMKGLAMQNVHIPSEKAKGPLDSIVMYDKLKIDEILFGTPGKDGATVKGFDLSLDTTNKAEKIGYVWTIANIDATFEKGGKNPLAPLDMNTFNGSLTSKGSWSPTSGDTSLDQLELEAKELGKINITGSLGGYDLAFLEAVQKTQENMSKADADKDAAGLAILGLAEQLNLKNLSIRFDNDTLTQKVLDYYAKQQGADGKQLGEQMKMMVPLMATQLKNPEFAQQLKVAADKYFTDPKSLTISASPDQPVTFASIVATASLDPTKIIQLLKISVDANN